MKRKILNTVFVSVIIVSLVAGLIRTVFFPKEINEYENRPADKMTAFSFSGFVNSSFQSSVENGLMDQIPFAQSLKKAYNDINSLYLKKLTDPLKQASQNRYMELMGMKLYDGEYFCTQKYDLETYKTGIEKRISNINAVVNAHPETEFFGYYVEKDIDINFETGERFGAYDYIKDKINIQNFSKFSVDSFETYKKYFYKTDHHWNLDGSYKAYTEIVEMLTDGQMPLIPSDTKILTEEFSGAYAKGKGIAGYKEQLKVNVFDYKPSEIYYYGAKQEKYGHSDTSFSYGGWYGADIGEVVFKNYAPEKENLLVIGDSYDNAILEILSSHFNTLCSIDLRYNKEFELSSYLEQHNIDKVLIIGSANVFFAEDFNLEDKNI